MSVVRYKIKPKRWRSRILGGLRIATCTHEREVHESMDEPGTCIYICLKCGSGFKVS